MRIRTILVALATFSFLLAGTVSAQTRLIVGGTTEASGLDPRRVNDVPSFQRIYTMFEPLLVFEKDLSYRPRLATSWSFSEDGSEITFQLREGVLFHHGTEFTSADVKYTIEWMTNPENPVLNRQLWSSLARVETPDRYTVVVHLDPVNVWALNALARLPIVPADLGDLDSFPTDPKGTGPFEFVEWVRDDRLVVRKFANYWDTDLGNIDEVVIRSIPEDAGRLLAFEASEVDLYHGQVVPIEVPRLEASGNVVSRTTGLGWTYLGFNQRVPELADARVRQAFYHLLPAQAIVQRVYNGIGTVSAGPVAPESIYYSPNVPTYPYDPERARALLAEAGYANGFTVRLHTNAANAVRLLIAEVLQFEAAQVGITVEIVGEEFGAFIDRVMSDNRDFELFILGWAGNVDPDYATYGLFKTGASNNYVGYSNPRVDELLDLGRLTAPESPESIAIYQEVQDLLMADVPFAFINNTEEIGLVQPWIQGWSVHPYSSSTYMDLHKVTKNR
jgi:peptide/nickel transport system substrate-binding protein